MFKTMGTSVSGAVHEIVSAQEPSQGRCVPQNKYVCRVCEWVGKRVSQVCLQQGFRDFQE